MWQRIIVFIAVFLAAAVYGRNISYHVITTVEPGMSIGVAVDDKVYPLTPKSETPVLFAGHAPEATTEYHYVKLDNASTITEKEPFQRQPVQKDTPNEFFGRSWNKKSITPLPQILEPIHAIHRVKTKLHKEGEIPTIHITVNDTEFDQFHTNNFNQTKINADVSYISLNDVHTIKDVEMEMAGRISRIFPKVSYNIKFPKKHTLFKYRDLKLRSLVTDPSYLREQLSYDVTNAAGVPVSGYSFVRLIINNKPYGLYGVVENYKKTWYQNEFADGYEDYERGISYQGSGIVSDLRVLNDSADYEKFYKIKSKPSNGQGEDNMDMLVDLIQFINGTTSDSRDKWEKRMNIESVLRNVALEIALGFSDGYLVNSNNYYLYHDPVTKRFIYLPSDFDFNFGSTITRLKDMWTGNYTQYPGFKLRPLTTKLMLIPEFSQRLEYILFEIVDKAMNPRVLGGRLDELIDFIKEDVEWDSKLHDTYKFPDIIKGLLTVKSQLNGLFPNPPVDFFASVDFIWRLYKPIPFEKAINGPTGHISLAGLREWIEKQSKNILTHLPKSSTS